MTQRNNEKLMLIYTKVLAFIADLSSNQWFSIRTKTLTSYNEIEDSKVFHQV